MKSLCLAAYAVLVPPVLAGSVIADDSTSLALGSRLRVTAANE